MSKSTDKKPFYKRVWFWILVIIAIIVIANAGGGNKTSTTGDSSTTTKAAQKWDGVAFYDKIQTGQSKADVDAMAGKTPNCTESDTEQVGNTKVCSYGNLFTDKQSVVVTYNNDAVFSKTRQTN
jgi:hypothetical protein